MKVNMKKTLSNVTNKCFVSGSASLVFSNVFKCSANDKMMENVPRDDMIIHPSWAATTPKCGSQAIPILPMNVP